MFGFKTRWGLLLIGLPRLEWLATHISVSRAIYLIPGGK